MNKETHYSDGEIGEYKLIPDFLPSPSEIEQRLHCVVFTLRNDIFWIISLRKANKREEKRYEKFIT